MTSRLQYVCMLLLCLLFVRQAQAQGSEEYTGGMTVKLNDTGSKYIRFITWHQIWTRAHENNPGTAVNGIPQDYTYDIGIRRSRFLTYSQINSRFLVLLHVGINNQTFTTGGVPNGGITGNGGTGTLGKKPGIFIHDAWTEYTVFPAKSFATGEARKFSMAVGAGLHYWHGVSRLSSASTLNFMAIDAPIFNWYNIEISDQFARQFGWYFKGKAGKLDYRMHINKPFATNTVPDTAQANYNWAVDNNLTGKPSYGGYFMYQFWDQESNLLPFTVGTYVGTRRVFNLGAGFYYNPEGTATRQQPGNPAAPLKRHNISIVAADVFLDMPVGNKEKNMAVTAYSVFYKYNYGPNYFRTVGIMNVGARDPQFTGAVSQTGFGNARPLFGTGNTWYTEIGYLLPKGLFGAKKGRFQPYVETIYQTFERYEGSFFSWSGGMNYFLDGHNAKITLRYASRPLIMNNRANGNAGEWTLQTQVYL